MSSLAVPCFSRIWSSFLSVSGVSLVMVLTPKRCIFSLRQCRAMRGRIVQPFLRWRPVIAGFPVGAIRKSFFQIVRADAPIEGNEGTGSALARLL